MGFSLSQCYANFFTTFKLNISSSLALPPTHPWIGLPCLNIFVRKIPTHWNWIPPYTLKCFPSSSHGPHPVLASQSMTSVLLLNQKIGLLYGWLLSPVLWMLPHWRPHTRFSSMHFKIYTKLFFRVLSGLQGFGNTATCLMDMPHCSQVLDWGFWSSLHSAGRSITLGSAVAILN